MAVGLIWLRAWALGVFSQGWGLGRRFRMRGSIRPGRWPTLVWAINVNRRVSSCVADSPRATHSPTPQLYCVLEAQLTGVLTGVAGRLRHEQTDHVVGQQVPP